MDEYLNDTYQIIPQMQEKVLFHNKKLKTFDDFISQYGEIIDKLTKSNEDFEKKLNGNQLFSKLPKFRTESDESDFLTN